MVPPVVTAVAAALLALLYLGLSLLVIRARVAARVALGTGGDRRVERAMRVHANFAEYAPFTLLLLALLEGLGGPRWAVALLALLLVVGRAAHAYGMSQEPEALVWRQVGMAATFAALGLAAPVLMVAVALR